MQNAIIKIEEDSPLRNKAHKGDRLISINGHPVEDVLDYQYYSCNSRLIVKLMSRDGKIREVRIKKDESESLGLAFEDTLMDEAWGCTNRCKFCFVDQLPRGLRKTLYFKDDDVRLSFLTGSYITLTNLSERELQRICDLRVSPINVSVHTTNLRLRAELMGNPSAANIMDPLRRLSSAGVIMDCQIVCCPGHNDREELSRTMADLALLYPAVNSVSIVPVGLTMHRRGLAELTPFSNALASETIDLVEAFAEKCLHDYGSRIFFCADELYIKAGRPVRSDEYYEEYSQLENGVGMLRLLETEFMVALEHTDSGAGKGLPFSIATGVAAAPLINKLLLTAAEKCSKIKGQVYAIHNDFLGHSIDVSGLVTGGDLTAQLMGQKLGKRVLIPQTMLRYGEGVFLDDMTLAEAAAAIGVPVIPVGNSGEELLAAMLGIN